VFYEPPWAEVREVKRRLLQTSVKKKRCDSDILHLVTGRIFRGVRKIAKSYC
jgi:hypothetical protein